ncbi:hypothetical protein [Legionella sp. PC997]|uniref:hypothetical protein n=1 Tax=Legionella sp. PC997 TaxID=2755562 RepID=UPI001860ACEA|nr:hypothetical protein [Legionella sp. PC997]QMT60573.1 hypothetical protein HBNCFIEN_01946 [Legionella sp. PC997]
MQYIANFWTMDVVTSFIERMNAQLTEKVIPLCGWFTVLDNIRSQRVMTKLRMIRDKHGDFLHLKLTQSILWRNNYLFGLVINQSNCII